MSELVLDAEGCGPVTAHVGQPFQDPQTRALTVRLTVKDAGGAIRWRDMVRGKPLDAEFLQGIIAEEGGVVLTRAAACDLVALIRQTCKSR